MSERVIGLGEVDSYLPTDGWILLFGGVTREGNRRARRAIRAAMQSKTPVLWFDGFGETWERPDGGRVELDFEVPDDSVVVIDYSKEEQDHWLNRMVEGIPAAIMDPIEMVEGGLSEPGTGRAPVLTSMRRFVKRTLFTFQKKVLRRIAQIFRGRVGWKIVKDDVILLAASTPPPATIIYGDDFALTQGWRAARIWPDVPTAMELTGG